MAVRCVMHRSVASADDDAVRVRTAMGGTAEAHCAAWLGSQSRRALMAQVGVGTIDQALMAVLPRLIAENDGPTMIVENWNNNMFRIITHRKLS